MRVVSLRLQDWRCFEDCSLELPDGLIGVRGPNGAGKSTLVEAIGWALFGKTRKGGRVAELRRQGTGRGRSSVELVLQLGETVYRVERVVGGQANLWIDDVLECSRSRDTNARIARELDLTWEVFARTVFAQQKDVAALDPSQTAPQRQAHVERLLGLGRFRRAAEAARGDARRLAAELDGLREMAPDLPALEAELEQAERDAAEGDPAVAEAESRLQAATATRGAARAAHDAEKERAGRVQPLERERAHLRERVAALEAEIAKLEGQRGERERARARLAEIEPRCAELAGAEGERELWDGLARAAGELAEAEQALAAIPFDAGAGERDAERFGAERAEREQLEAERAGLEAALERAAARVQALRAAAEAGDVEACERELAGASAERERLLEERSLLAARMDGDRRHVQEVEAGGPDTPCPVCKKPYGTEYDSLLAGYRERIVAAEGRLPELEELLGALDGRRVAAAKALDGARRAREGLDGTEGAGTLAEAERAAVTVEERLAAVRGRVAELEASLPQLERAVREHAESAARWRERDTVRRERADRYAEACAALGVAAYESERHDACRRRCGELAELTAEATPLHAVLVGSGELDGELAEVRRRADEARTAERETGVELANLALDPARLIELEAALAEAERARDEANGRWHGLRARAEASSAAVQSARTRLAEGRARHDEIALRQAEQRRHEVAAGLLSAYRDHQAQRAAPSLEQGAAELLSATTDGRYGDVRLSDDYRLLILDRGQEHELARYSGGEQDLANLCLRLAIADWVARERGVELGFIVLDEVFGSQDEERRQRLLGELRALSNRFRQVLVITHLPDIADLCDAQLEVTIDEPGRSTARFAA